MFRARASRPASDAVAASDPLLASARESWRWYDRHAGRARRSYQALEVFQIGSGAMIPLAAAVHWPIAVSASLGAGIAFAGGIRSAFRWQTNWVTWSITAAKMQHEISLYTARIPPYNHDSGGQRLLRSVARLEMAETVQWATQAQQGEQGQVTTSSTNSNGGP